MEKKTSTKVNTKSNAINDIREHIDALVSTIKKYRYRLERTYDMDDEIKRLNFLYEEVRLWGKPYQPYTLEQKERTRIYDGIRDAIKRDRKQIDSISVARTTFCSLIHLDKKIVNKLIDGTYHLTKTSASEQELEGHNTVNNEWYAIIVADSEGNQVGDCRWLEYKMRLLAVQEDTPDANGESSKPNKSLDPDFSSLIKSF